MKREETGKSDVKQKLLVISTTSGRRAKCSPKPVDREWAVEQVERCKSWYWLGHAEAEAEAEAEAASASAKGKVAVGYSNQKYTEAYAHWLSSIMFCQYRSGTVERTRSRPCSEQQRTPYMFGETMTRPKTPLPLSNTDGWCEC